MGGRAKGSKAKSRGKNRAGEGTKRANIVEVTGVARTGAGPARGTAERLGDDLELVRSDGFRDLCRTRPQDFTRRRKLPHDVLTESVLAKRGRSLELDLRQLGKEGLLDEAGVSAQAFSKARQKLDPKALKKLVRHHARGVYRDGGYLTWFGMVAVGVDGSSVDVDTNPETLDKWGNASNPGTRPQAQAGISTAYDPLNRQIVDVTVNRCAFNERAEVPGHVEACREAVGDAGLCLFLDRGYPSIALLARLVEGGAHFVVRCPRTFLADEFEACAAAGGDVTVEVELTRERLRCLADAGEEELLGRLLALGSIRLRLVLVDIGADQPERLVTDLGAERVTGEDLKGGYHLRWGVTPNSE